MKSLDDVMRAGTLALKEKNKRKFFEVSEAGLRAFPVSEDPRKFAEIFDRLIFQYSNSSDPEIVYDKCSRLCDWDEETNGETAWGLLGRGVAAFARKDFATADTFFLLSAAKPLHDRFAIAAGVFSRRPPVATKGFDKSIQLPGAGKMQTEIRHMPKSDDIVHLVSADSAYLRKYAGSFLKASADHGDGFHHIHVVNPKDGDLDYVDDLARSLQAKVNLSYEVSPIVDELAQGRERYGYLICPRFLIAPQLLDFYGRPLFITDIDMATSKSWDRIRKQFEGFDLGLRVVHGNYPWRQVAAGASLFGNTKGGREFAERVAAYISHVMDFDHKQNWMIDQNALYAATEYANVHLRSLNRFCTNSAHFDCATAAQYLEGGKEAFAASV